MRAGLIGFILGLLVGAGAVILLPSWEYLLPKTYVVRSVESFFPNEAQDVQATFMVYRTGKSGHVQELFCHLPPGFELAQTTDDPAHGIRRLRVGGVAERYAFGEIAYLCEVVD
jgi:hypothetical protein